MKPVLHKTRTLLAVYYANMMEFRAELYLWVIAGLLPFIMMGVWISASQAPGNALNMSPSQVVRYFICAFIARQLSIAWVIWDFEFHVVQGKLSPLLLQPIDPGWRFVAAHISEQAARLPFAAIIIAAVLWMYPGALWRPAVADIALALAAMYMAFIVRFLMQYSLAMLCFWLERASGAETLMYLPYLFLSGLIAPLHTFPPLIRDLAMLTPFPYLVYFPAQILAGGAHASAIPVLRGFLVMLAWAVLLWLLNRCLWRRGLRHYSGMGA